MKSLFDKINIGKIKMKNRLMRSATWENMADEDGYVTDRLIDTLEDLAKGGVGAVVSGCGYVTGEEQPNPGMTAIWDDRYIPGLKELSDRIHRHDTPIIFQCIYGGSRTTFNLGNRIIWGPSAVENPITKVIPQEMTVGNIHTLVKDFGQAARRAEKAGFDGFQIHAGHGYLFSQFLTPYYNRRTDEYGGSIENRSRIIIDTLKEVRAQVSDDYPIMIKINCSDFLDEDGFTLEESIQVAIELEKNGITAIEISGGNSLNGWQSGPIKDKIIKEEKQCYFSDYAAQIAEAVSVPVISTGGNRSVSLMEKKLNGSALTAFGISRVTHCEPDLPGRWQAGDHARPKCVSCNQCWHEDGNTCVLNRKS
ncbi:NADH:flavin oxidoreductase [Maridesulfovibrio sp.]|uniref:NADH:flavin oxidoreductase n=1 Tax=Maridesulfovibrio sp. TaxID=2795000 RepID=UPI0029F4C2D1|nr:NADH:flavin oxidoreductase [Maridesulfovibrio sp.]